MIRRLNVLLWRQLGNAPDQAELFVRDPSATIGDVAEQMGVGRTWLSVDGAPTSPTATLAAAGVVSGSSLAAPPGVRLPADTPEYGPYLTLETGLDSGRCFPLEIGTAWIGAKDHLAVPILTDPQVAWEHCRLDVGHDGEVWLSAGRSLGVTHVDGVVLSEPVRLVPGQQIRVGNTDLQFWRGEGYDRRAPLVAGITGDRFRRPPRRYEWVQAPVVVVPELKEPREQKPIFSIAAFMTPLLFAAVMVLVLHSLVYAVFGFLSPVAAVGTYLEGKRRYRRAKRGGDRASRQALEVFGVELAEQRQAVQRQLSDIAGPLAGLRQRAALPSERLWERRSSHPDFLQVRLATGHVTFVPRLAPEGPIANDLVRAHVDGIAAAGVDTALLPLGRGWIGVCGDRAAALAVARSLILQVATSSGPSDLSLRLDVAPEREADWRWAVWLPHVVADEGGAGSASGPGVQLAVVDTDHPDPGGLTVGSGLALAADFGRLPDRCSTVISVDAQGALVVHDLGGGGQDGPHLATGVGADVAESWARRLARYEDSDGQVLRLPHTVDGGELWGPGGGPTGLLWPVGEGAEGPVTIDLAGPFPHVVIAGVAGSGLTETLRGLVAALSCTSPGRAVVAVLDLAGGGLLPLSGFPHVAGIAVDAGSAQMQDGPLARLETEIQRRADVIRAAGHETLQSYVAAGGHALPHLVIAVDDPGTLPFDRASTLEAIVRVAAASTHLGVHVVLATTQPNGRASTLLRDSATRIALRLAAPAAEAFVGVAFPASIPRSRPGRAWYQVADGPAQPVQVATSVGPARWRGAPVEVTFDWAATVTPPGGESVLDDLMAAAVRRGGTPAVPLWGLADAAGLPVTASRLSELLGLSDAEAFDPATMWRPRPLARFLRVPIGVDDRGQPVEMDLKEAAFEGMGPHGLVVGATGSGKSELLRTLVTALIATHAPEFMSLVLVDFKGGATFAGFTGLPHVAGMITNLESDLSSVDRMEAALLGEQQRRQELLRQAGNLGSAYEYRQARAAEPTLAPMPELLVIVDEFAELLEQRPGFIDMFGSIGRLGRSLGVHLLLATQRLEEGRLRGLESHLRYRVSLRTNSVSESRTVLGVSDAASLPSEPGVGYLKVDSPKLERFRAALVSAPRQGVSEGPSELDVITARARPAAPATHQVWLPVLPERLSLGRFVGRLEVSAERGLQMAEGVELGAQQAPIGIIDRPRQQTRAALVPDFTGATGHLALIGSPRSGKTTFLRTLVASLALTHTPEEVHVYGLDFAGGGLLGLAGLPHVGGVAHERDPELIGRVASHVAAVVAARTQLFQEHGIDSPEQFRRERVDGRFGAGAGDVYLLIDGWAGLRAWSERLEDQVTDIAKQGLGVGVHVVLTSGRWSDLRAPIRDAVLGRIELRLTDPFESAVGRRDAENVPVGSPGRGIVDTGEHFLTALPTLGPEEEAETGWGELVAAVAGAWTGAPAPPVRVLPSQVTIAELPKAEGPLVPYGVAEPDMAPAVLDFRGVDQHVVILGDSLSGKTSALRTLLAQIVSANTPDEARVLLVDPRRNLMDVVPTDHRFGYAGSAAGADQEIARFRSALDRRLPGPDITLQQLRDRSWWEGPDGYLVVDDHDLIVTQTSNPLLPVVDLLAQASDVGLHVVLARRVAGWQRAQYEPVVQRLREIGATVVLLSGDPTEGVIASGVRAMPRPAGRAALLQYRRPPTNVQIALAEADGVRPGS